MQSVVAHIQENDVVNPTIILLEERNRQKNINPNARWYVCSDIHLYISRNLLTNYSLEVITTKMCPQWPRGYVEEFVTHNSVIQHKSTAKTVPFLPSRKLKQPQRRR